MQRKLREELEKYRKVKRMRVRKDKPGRKYSIGMACLATEEQAKLAIKMLNKTKHYVANEYLSKQIVHKRKIKDTRNLWMKNIFMKKRPAMHMDQKTSNKIIQKEHQLICH